METAFDFKTGKWNIAWPGRISKHDLVYLTPPEDPMQGIPLGNGDVGALCWCEGSKLIIALNKSDLWDDAEFETFHAGKPAEMEHQTSLRHAGRLIIDFKHPVFDAFYLKDFKGRLSLADASMIISAESIFGKVEIKAFLSYTDGSLHLDIKSTLEDDPDVDVKLQRYGSRTFSYWYSLVKCDPELGAVKGTDSFIESKIIGISQELSGGTFAVGVKAHDLVNRRIETSREHSRSAGMKVAGEKEGRFSLAVKITSPMTIDAVVCVQKDLKKLNAASIADFQRKHKKTWKDFWLRSLVEVGNDYLDNLWCLAMYYCKASQGAKYPGRFINGLWNWNRDVQPWCFYFHWNQQQIYWGLNAAGHHELVDAYLNFRFNGVEVASQNAKDYFGVEDGLVISDVSERRGYNSASEFKNHTPAAEVALAFWQHYQYTCDRKFLEEKAMPFMVKASRFFQTLFKKEKDGKYHAIAGTGYEGSVELHDAISELVYAKALFEATLEALEVLEVELEECEIWKDICENLAPFRKFKLNSDFCDIKNKERYYKFGPFKGRKMLGDEIYAAGEGIKEKRCLMSMTPTPEPEKYDNILEIFQKLENGILPNVALVRELEWNYSGIFPGVEYSPVFPSNQMGLKDKKSEAYKTMVNTMKYYAADRWGGDLYPIAIARLGLAKEFWECMEGYPDRWQWFCNGWWHYGSEFRKPEDSMKFVANRVRTIKNNKCDSEPTTLFKSSSFSHMGMEPLGSVTCGLNEALLQSYDDIIRIAPAIDKKRSARFTLHAIGGFEVSAEIEKGKVRWFAIKSLQGNICKIANPWKQAWAYCDKKKLFETAKRQFELETAKGQIVVFVPQPDLMKGWKVIKEKPVANKSFKASKTGLVKLGRERMF